MKKEKTMINAKERTQIFKRSFSSVPMTYEFTAELAGTGEVSGMVEVEITQTLFRKKHLKIPLKRNNVIKATFWDTFMDVYVTADQDVSIEKPQKSMSATPLIVGLILMVLALASVVMIASFNQ